MPSRFEQTDITASICPQRAKHSAEVTPGPAGTLVGSRIKIVDAPFESAGDSSLLLVSRASDHQPSDSTAAEAKRGNRKPAPPKRPLFDHLFIPRPVRGRHNLKRHPVEYNTARPLSRLARCLSTMTRQSLS
jgi:hypothetical protein